MKKFLNGKVFLLFIFAITIVLIVFLFEYFFTDKKIGVPLDDAFIHFQFSKKISDGEGLSYNDNVKTPGSTSVLWTYAITPLFILTDNHLFSALFLNVIFYIASTIVFFYLAKEILRKENIAFILSICFLLAGRNIWAALSGMEVTFFTFLFLLSLLFEFKNRQFFATFVLGLATLTRPEGYLLFFFFMLIRLYHALKLKSKKIFLFLFLHTAIFLLINLPSVLFCLSTTNKIFPNTFYAQKIPDLTTLSVLRIAVKYLLVYSFYLFNDNFLLLLFFPFGIYYLVKEKKYVLILLISIGFPVFASFMAPNLRHHARYTMPFIAVYLLTSYLGFEFAIQKFSFLKKWSRILIVAQITAIILGSFYWARNLFLNVRDINAVQVKLGYWVKENIPNDDLIALNDIGAIKYISDRKILDTVGLVSPEIIDKIKGLNKQKRQEPILEVMRKQNAKYLIIFPSWYPDIAKKFSECEIYRVRPDSYSIIEDDMVVYKLPENY